MNNAVTPSRWFQGWRSAARATQIDPADLGTAFGLDASFDETFTAPQDLPAQAKPGWMQRLASRGKHAA